MPPNVKTKRTNAQKQQAYRQNQSQETADARRETERLRNITYWKGLSQSQLQHNRQKMAQSNACRRSQETEDQTEARREKNRLQTAAHRNPIEQVNTNNISFTEIGHHQHSCGEMEIECQFCGSFNFLQERPKDGKFNNCCHKGKVLVHVQQEYPQYLRQIISDPEHMHYRNFRDNIRSYNSALSFASMGAQIADPTGHGPYCFRVHGQIYHRTSNLHPNGGEHRQFAQLYVVESREANATRTNNIHNQGCLHEIMQNLDHLIRQHNVYAKAYKTLGEVEQEEAERARQENRSLPVVNMAFTRDRNSDRRR